jgi:hypothetical protein
MLGDNLDFPLDALAPLTISGFCKRGNLLLLLFHYAFPQSNLVHAEVSSGVREMYTHTDYVSRHYRLRRMAGNNGLGKESLRDGTH